MRVSSSRPCSLAGPSCAVHCSKLGQHQQQRAGEGSELEGTTQQLTALLLRCTGAGAEETSMVVVTKNAIYTVADDEDE